MQALEIQSYINIYGFLGEEKSLRVWDMGHAVILRVLSLMGLPVGAVGWDAWCSQPRGWGGVVGAVFEELRFGHWSEMGGETDAGDS